MAELSKDGSLADLEVDLVGEDIPKQSLPDRWALVALDLLADLVASGAVSGAVSMVEEAEVGSEAASRIEAAMVAGEVVLDTKEAADFRPEGVMEEIAVGMEDPMGTELLQMPQLVQAAGAGEAVGMVEEDMAAPLIVTALECQRQLVGMTRAVAVAHMMTDPVDIVEVVATTTVMDLVEVVATWSR